MIPALFVRAVEKDIWVLGICADYLEDDGKDGSILRLIADNHFLLDDSGYCSASRYLYGYGDGDGQGDGYGFQNGSGYGYYDYYGIGPGYYGDGYYGDGYGYTTGNGGSSYGGSIVDSRYGIGYGVSI